MKELTLAEKLFRRLSRKEKARIKLEQRKAEIEAQAQDSKLLSEYLDVLSQLNVQQKSVKEDLEPLRLAMQSEGLSSLEDKDVRVTTKKDYTKTVIDTTLFYEYFKPTSKTYQKVVVEQSVKGSIKVEVKQADTNYTIYHRVYEDKFYNVAQMSVYDEENDVTVDVFYIFDNDDVRIMLGVDPEEDIRATMLKEVMSDG